MRVLQINQSDILGGAAIAGYRLHQGLIKEGVDSRLLVDTVNSDSDQVSQIHRKRFTEDITSRFASILGLNYINLGSTFKIPDHPDFQSAKVINFHNLHGNYFNYLALSKLTNLKPSVLTLHDMWSFTGHCSYSFDCERWEKGCGSCPDLTTYPPTSRDSTRIEWQLKKWSYSKSNLVIVAPSLWLERQARRSILNRYPIHHIPHGIDTHSYKPVDAEHSRRLLEIPPHKKVLMFGAQSLNEFRKGGDLLMKALQTLPASIQRDIVLITIGNGGQSLSKAINMPVINLGYLSGDHLKSVVYSAADIFLFPTRADNLPLTLMESLSCGTPIVSFDIGGVPDLVRPGQTGCLAKPEDVEDFTSKIIRLLENNNLRKAMSQNCRSLATAEYSLELQANRYINLYRQLLTGN